MNYAMTTPCDDCPFLKRMAHGFTLARLREFASGEFACHKTCDDNEDGDFIAGSDSLHCAGALIWLEKRGRSTQMMRIMERLRGYDRTKLDMTAEVR